MMSLETIYAYETLRKIYGYILHIHYYCIKILEVENRVSVFYNL